MYSVFFLFFLAQVTSEVSMHTSSCMSFCIESGELFSVADKATIKNQANCVFYCFLWHY